MSSSYRFYSRYLVSLLLCLAVVVGTLTICMLGNAITILATVARDKISFSAGVAYVDYVKAVPGINIVDTHGNRLQSIVGIYAAMPYARIERLGVTSIDDSLKLAKILDKLRNYVLPAWRRHVGNVSGLSIALWIFASIDKVKGKILEEYDTFVSVPIKLGYVEKGYSPRITIVVDLSKIKPRIINVSQIMSKNTMCRKIGKHNLRISQEDVGCENYGLYCKCVFWDLEESYYHTDNEDIPLLIVRNDWTDSNDYPEDVAFIDTWIVFDYRKLEKLYLYASAKDVNVGEIQLVLWSSYNAVYIDFTEGFANSRYLGTKPSFLDDAIIAIVAKGSLDFGVITKYESICPLPCPCDDEDLYFPTETFNGTIMEIYMVYNSSIGAYVPKYLNYSIDEDPYDGEGWDKYLDYVLQNAELYDYVYGQSQAVFKYLSYSSDVDAFSIDVLSLVLTKMPRVPSWAKKVPISAGIGWKCKQSVVTTLFVRAVSAYADDYVYLWLYRTRYAVFINGESRKLFAPIVDVDSYYWE